MKIKVLLSLHVFFKFFVDLLLKVQMFLSEGRGGGKKMWMDVQFAPKLKKLSQPPLECCGDRQAPPPL